MLITNLYTNDMNQTKDKQMGEVQGDISKQNLRRHQHVIQNFDMPQNF